MPHLESSRNLLSLGPRLRTLRDLNTDDLVRAVGASRWVEAVPALRRLFDLPALAFARFLEEFDNQWILSGPGRASAGLLGRLGSRVCFTGAEPLTEGPRLFVANHPGLGDVLALVSRLARSDLKIVARDRPFLRALPGLSRSLILVPDRGGRVLRDLENHLKAGGAVLTFPAGRIEPDPAWFRPTGWADWSASTALLLRRVPGLRVQPCLVAGIRAAGFVDPWLARWRRFADEREWTAAVLQLFLQVLWARPRYHRIDVALGEPLTDPSQLPRQMEVLAQGLLRDLKGS